MRRLFLAAGAPGGGDPAASTLRFRAPHGLLMGSPACKGDCIVPQNSAGSSAPPHPHAAHSWAAWPRHPTRRRCAHAGQPAVPAPSGRYAGPRTPASKTGSSPWRLGAHLTLFPSHATFMPAHFEYPGAAPCEVPTELSMRGALTTPFMLCALLLLTQINIMAAHTV